MRGGTQASLGYDSVIGWERNRKRGQPDTSLMKLELRVGFGVMARRMTQLYEIIPGCAQCFSAP